MFSRAKKTRHAVDALVAEVDALRTLVNEQTARIDAGATHNRSVADRLGDIEARVTGLGAELSRQLHELGTDIDELSKRVDNDTTAQAVDALKAAQIRLATEQARYEITFRQDLADLADQLLRRPKQPPVT